MPYIKEEARQELAIGRGAANAGELNFILTCVVLNYIDERGESYQAYNDAIGALEGAKLELYRRHVAPYENEKMKENGDV